MAKGHRSQIKRERNATEGYKTIRKVILCESTLFRRHASF